MVSMTEPDVALTDFLLAVECGFFVFLVLKHGKHVQPLRAWSAAFFAGTGMAALLGGLVHGFFLDPDSLGNRLLWPATLLSIGITAVTMWVLGALLIRPGIRVARVMAPAAGALLIYGACVLLYAQTFAVAVIFYLPAVVFLLAALIYCARRNPRPQIHSAILGLLLSLIAAGIQQTGIGLHPGYFNHNALYHLIQAVALYLIFRGAFWFSTHDLAQIYGENIKPPNSVQG